MELREYLDYLVDFLQKSVANAKAEGLIVGISGGIDSAVVAKLIQKACPNNYLTVWMPLESSELDLECTNQLITSSNLITTKMELSDVFLIMVKNLKNTDVEITELALANTKARLRMTSLYALAQSKKYLVVGTDNAAEWHIGYFTKHGDGAVDLVPLIYLLKNEVKQAAQILGVPKIIIDREPTASLWENQTDEKEIGFSYDLIDQYLLGDRNNSKLNERINELHQQSEHKRNMAIKPKEFNRNN